MRSIGWLVLLAACGAPVSFTGEEIGVVPATAETHGDGSPGALDGDFGSPTDGTPDAARDVNADLTLVGGVGTIDVTHANVEGSCTAEWTITPTVDGTNIFLAYDDVAPPADALCTWELSFQLTNIPAGTWGVLALQAQGIVEVQ